MQLKDYEAMVEIESDFEEGEAEIRRM